MSLLRRKNADLTAEQTQAAEEQVAVDRAAKAEGKGRPTPKRRESERRRGPVAPPPRTQREAYQRSKATGGRKLTKDERRDLAAQRRERMMRGDDAYLMPRDKGEVRAYVRDLVDARRNLAGLLLPIAALSFVTLLVPNPIVQAYGPMVLMVAILAAVLDSVIFGRKLSRLVRERFPKGDKSGQSTRGSALGFYAFNRACLIRKWRIPRPRVDRGDAVA